MATEILERWAPILVGVELVTADKGTFRVSADDERLFDKADARRFPAPGEVARLLEPVFGPPITWRKARPT
ncbi:MAG: Rdx family protein [Candidatus Dormibacteraeota bacterium]|nr:Rdx family protein [Candidatus Dormibacteraeota bacterium]